MSDKPIVSSKKGRPRKSRIIRESPYENGIRITLRRDFLGPLRQYVSEEFPFESKRLIKDITAAMAFDSHSREHTAIIYLEEDDMDGYIALQYACMHFVLESQEVFSHFGKNLTEEDNNDND